MPGPPAVVSVSTSVAPRRLVVHLVEQPTRPPRVPIGQQAPDPVRTVGRGDGVSGRTRGPDPAAGSVSEWGALVVAALRFLG